MRSSPSTLELRRELELRLTHGRCAYCGARASRGRPLTREHLIPRSKGGRRHDPRIIVPACARCNHRRGCQALVLFLLSQPRRISALVDHLQSLPIETLRHVDLRVFGEIYAALWVLGESRAAGPSARARLRQFCGGRAVHRRRYAARRAIETAAGRIARQRPDDGNTVTMCRIPPSAEPESYLTTLESVAAVEARLFELLGAVWYARPAEVEREIRRRLSAASSDAGARDRSEPEPELDRSLNRPTARRLRVDRRRGRSPKRRAA